MRVYLVMVSDNLCLCESVRLCQSSEGRIVDAGGIVL